MGEATRRFRELAHNSLRNQTLTMTERKIDPEAPEKRQAETPDGYIPPGRPTNDQRPHLGPERQNQARPTIEDEATTGSNPGPPTGRTGADPNRETPGPRAGYAPNPFDAPFTGFAPASRCAGTRSRAGSEYPTDTILSPW